MNRTDESRFPERVNEKGLFCVAAAVSAAPGSQTRAAETAAATQKQPGSPDPPTLSRAGRGGRKRVWIIAGIGLVSLVLVGAVAGVAWRRGPAGVLSDPAWTLRVTSQVRTGHQRAERLAFADRGRLLAVTCPRYNRLVLFRVADGDRLTLSHDIALGGRPVAVAAGADRLYVLQRPAGDARHVEPAWWDAFDFEGRAKGDRFRVGFDPDDMALFDEGHKAVVLLSGSAEGEANRPLPSVLIVDLSSPEKPLCRGSVVFDQPGDDPERLLIRHEPVAGQSGPHVAVILRRSNRIVWLDVADADSPRLIRGQPLPGTDAPATITAPERAASGWAPSPAPPCGAWNRPCPPGGSRWMDWGPPSRSSRTCSL